MAWGRIVEITIGPGSSMPSSLPGVGGSMASITGQAGAGKAGQTIRDLHMNFKVKKALGRGAGAPTAEIKIFNMSAASYAHFVSINSGLMLAVGYQDESVGALVQDSTAAGGSPLANFQQNVGVPLMLFSGAIRFCRRYREKADWIVYIEAEAGMWNIGGAPYTVSMLPGISAYALLANLATTMKVSVRNLITVPQGSLYSGGFSFIGTVRDFLQKICDRIGFNFLIDGGEITLIPPLSNQGGTTGISTETSNPSASSQGIYLSKDTGLLQPPEPEQISVGIPDATAGVDGGSQTLPEMRWKITSLILPQAGPGQVMLVKSESFASGIAYMMVEEIEYNGDNRKDDWKMEALCIPVDSTGAQTQVAAA